LNVEQAKPLNFEPSIESPHCNCKNQVQPLRLMPKRSAIYFPLIYFTASVAATWPVMEPRMSPEPLG
jgi:hypothetical protein